MRTPRRAGYALALQYLLLAVVSVAALGPSLWILVSSFKPAGQVLSGASFSPPNPPTLQGYVDAFTKINLGGFIGNTIIYAVGGTLGATVIGLLAAYPLTRFHFRGRNTLVALFSLALAIPVVGLATPEFFVMRQLQLFDTRIGLVIFYSALFFPLAFVIFRAFLSSLPREVEEAAVIDGAGYFRILVSIILPLARPAIATVVVVSFVNIWNEFFFANLLTASSQNLNVQVALASFKAQFNFNVGATLAGTSIIMVVPTAVFLLMQRQVISGLTAGASK